MYRRLVAVPVSAALILGGLTVTQVVTTSTSASASEASMLKQVNAARAKKGLKPYRWNAHLADVAEAQARRMARQSRLYHNPNLAKNVGSFRRVGENVGYGPTTSAVQRGFMNSPGHRANILRDYTQIGIAEIRDSKGRLWIAQVFRKPVVKKQVKVLSATIAAPKPAAVKRSVTVKKAAPAKRSAPAKKAPVVKKKAVAAKPAAPVTPPVTAPVPVERWRVVYAVLGAANFLARVTGRYVPPDFLDQRTA